ncbi:unnamed protein product [Clonostachys rosea f. rosea IK726]|uniref:Uncharacterized protein n=1 Tax=Clonostachys rosea f. rosea IK726 TaxID=1349383 RepID=A0ACA9UE60_BIOOC|nr:unnamed protein product [Clonostachys rosea f. rosea IK726]
MSSEDELHAATGFHQLPLRIRDKANGINGLNSLHKITVEVPSRSLTATPNAPSHHQHHPSLSTAPSRLHKRCPESLQFLTSNGRLRSPTQSSMSSIPDSATTYSQSTFASPVSSSYASDLQEFFTGSRPSSRVFHRHKTSVTTCSTLINDEDETPVVHNISDKIDQYRSAGDVTPRSADEIEPEDFDDRRLTLTLTKPCPPLPGPEDLEDDEEDEEEEEEESAAENWETASVLSFDDCDPEEADAVLDFTMQMVYGVDSKDASVLPAKSREIVQRFIRDLGQCFWQAQASPDSNSNNMSSSASSSPAANGAAGDSQRGGKRKKKQQQKGGAGGEDGEDMSEGEGEAFLPAKKMKPTPRDEDLRLSCPFRKRNPTRFNVRDHHSCAMTFFPKFAELRQHIVKQHKRDDPSAFVCDRCNRDFPTRKELRDHQRLPRDQMCEISDSDPENGIDGPTATKLLSRKRTSGSSTEIQWREIWNILFPDDDDNIIYEYHFTPVIEHFELQNTYLASFELLKSSLRDKISNPATLETLAAKFHECFIETVMRCIAEAQTMPYANRSNKRSEQLASASAALTALTAPIAIAATPAATIAPIQTTTTVARKVREVLPRPDSGVVMTDDTSEESGSVMGSNTHRESIRTARSSQRGSSLAPRPRDLKHLSSSQNTHRSSATSSGVFDGSFTLPHHLQQQAFLAPQQQQQQQHQPTSTTAPMSFDSGYMAPVDVQAWTSGVQPPAASTHMYHHNIPENEIAPPPVFQDMGIPSDLGAAWAQQQFYAGGDMGLEPMGDEFTGFHNGR